ncbi:MAG: methionyl-tRNA formyltransferase [bacterium]|nr:methionyl-tRNA formyltransferase [bacterium]
MRIAFFGSSRFSCLILEKLLASAHEVACVITQPDQPAGRSMKLAPTQVALEAADAGITVLKPERLRGDEQTSARLEALKIDALLVASYGQILPKRILNLTPWPLNVHPSLLPKLRGASPIRTALLQGLSTTGCCIMRMTPRLDDGDVLLREQLEIDRVWNYEALESALGELGGRQAIQALDMCAQVSAQLTPQEHDHATYCSTYRRDHTWIDWSLPANQLSDFIRAWDPDLGALTLLDGKRLKVWRVEVATHEQAPAAFGTVLTVDRRNLTVACGSGILSLLNVQLENKRRMPISDFLAGHNVERGAVFGS